MKNYIVIIIFVFLLGCSAKVPMNQDDICVIIDENPRWSNSLLNAKKKWNADPSTVMAIIRQESPSTLKPHLIERNYLGLYLEKTF